ncbi:TPA: hypothetical protein ACF8S2_002538, partial [Legionella pneumophila]
MLGIEHPGFRSTPSGLHLLTCYRKKESKNARARARARGSDLAFCFSLPKRQNPPQALNKLFLLAPSFSRIPFMQFKDAIINPSNS